MSERIPADIKCPVPDCARGLYIVGPDAYGWLGLLCDSDGGVPHHLIRVYAKSRRQLFAEWRRAFRGKR